MDLELNDNEFKEIEIHFKKKNVKTKKNEINKSEKEFIKNILVQGKKEQKNFKY